MRLDFAHSMTKPSRTKPSGPEILFPGTGRCTFVCMATAVANLQDACPHQPLAVEPAILQSVPGLIGRVAEKTCVSASLCEQLLQVFSMHTTQPAASMSQLATFPASLPQRQYCAHLCVVSTICGIRAVADSLISCCILSRACASSRSRHSFSCVCVCGGAHKGGR